MLRDPVKLYIRGLHVKCLHLCQRAQLAEGLRGEAVAVRRGHRGQWGLGHVPEHHV